MTAQKFETGNEKKGKTMQTMDLLKAYPFDYLKSTKLNIGCGPDIKPGFINLDSRYEKADIEWNLDNLPLPFKGNRFEYIYASHILEHIPNLTALLNELYRIMQFGGILHIKVPYYKFSTAYTDPTHVRFFTEDTMNYYTQSHGYSYYTDYHFDILEMKVNRLPAKQNCRSFPKWHIKKYLGISWTGKKHEIEWKLRKPLI